MLCQVVMVGCFGIIDDENVIYISGVKQYVFGVYEGFDVDLFRKLIPEQSPGDTNSLFQAVINP